MDVRSPHGKDDKPIAVTSPARAETNRSCQADLVGFSSDLTCVSELLADLQAENNALRDQVARLRIAVENAMLETSIATADPALFGRVHDGSKPLVRGGEAANRHMVVYCARFVSSPAVLVHGLDQGHAYHICVDRDDLISFLREATAASDSVDDRVYSSGSRDAVGTRRGVSFSTASDAQAVEKVWPTNHVERHGRPSA